MIGAVSNTYAFTAGDMEAPSGTGPRVTPGRKEMSPEERATIAALKETDRKVRAHEQAHIAAGGTYVMGSAQFGYTKGPDGRQYAVSGEVSIDTSPGRTPQETVEKARVIRSAALAPADPSAQDRAVAAQAGQMEMEAARELDRQESDQGSSTQGNGAGLRMEPFERPIGLNVDVKA